ncbi:hypothetical protein MGI_03550 [Candida albicans P75016]|nr:hypothetical protein MGI_03550 [Candida albicans P75016]
MITITNIQLLTIKTIFVSIRHILKFCFIMYGYYSKWLKFLVRYHYYHFHCGRSFIYLSIREILYNGLHLAIYFLWCRFKNHKFYKWYSTNKVYVINESYVY